MKKLIWLFILIITPTVAFSQQKADYGIFGGVSSYFGDINSTKLLYSPRPAAGIFYRYNLHPRHSLRANLFAGRLSANDLDFDNAFQQNRNASFSGTVAEMALQFEFNFFPYATDGKKWNSSPYFAGGVGVAYIDANKDVAFFPVIPVSLGFKINMLKNVGLEAEYGFRKTFYDNFDGLILPPNNVWTHNNDWYTFTGISITWKMYNKLAVCCVYNDVDSKKRR
jgi:hypothetical protein